LNPDVEKFYLKAYQDVMGKGVIGTLWRFIHRKLDGELRLSNDSVLLELGSGHGQHFTQFRIPIGLYIQSDFQEVLGFKETFKIEDLKNLGMIKRWIDAEDLGLIPDGSIDCVIMTCVLAHLNNPQKSLSEIRRVLNDSGTFRIYVPCEPGLFLRFARFFTTKRELKRKGIKQGDIHWMEHRNHYPAMMFWINRVFKADTIVKKTYPFNFLSWDLNLFSIIHITKSPKF
jgi:SAM-dependent methyltransferase